MGAGATRQHRVPAVHSRGRGIRPEDRLEAPPRLGRSAPFVRALRGNQGARLRLVGGNAEFERRRLAGSRFLAVQEEPACHGDSRGHHRDKGNDEPDACAG